MKDNSAASKSRATDAPPVTEFGLLIDLTLLVGMAIPIVALAHRASIPSLVGFLVAGVLVGPSGLGCDRPYRGR